MKQDTNDIVIAITTEWERFEARLNWDAGGEMIRHFANMMRSMTFATSTIIDALRETADDLENDMKLYNDENEILEDGTTD